MIVLGDESGYERDKVQKVKLAVIEAKWKTEQPPAAFTLFGFADQENQTTRGTIKIPSAPGLTATRSVDEEVTQTRIRNDRHQKAYSPQESTRLCRLDRYYNPWGTSL